MENHSKILIQLLEKIRLQKGISRYKIAKDSGLNEVTVKRILDLDNEPTLSKFLAIAKALGVNFFFTSKDSDTDLNKAFQDAMDKLGRNPDNLPKN